MIKSHKSDPHKTLLQDFLAHVENLEPALYRTLKGDEAAAELARLQAIASAFFKIVSPDGFHQCGFNEECPECGESETHADGCKLAAALAPSPCGSASAS
jgi:hypothetical protein